MATISAMDPGLRYDDADAEAAQVRARNQDFMMRSYLQQQAAMAQHQLAQNGYNTQEKIAGMNINDHSLQRNADYGMQGLRGNQALELGKQQQAPQMGALDLQKQMYGDTRSDGQPARNFANAVAQAKMNELQGVLHPPAGGGGMGDQTAARDARAMKFGLLGIQAPQDPNEQMDNFVRQLVLSKAANADTGDLAGLVNAAKTGDLSKIPQAPQEAIPLEQVQGSLQSMAGQFGQKDNSVIGWNPTEQDVQAIVQRRDQTAQALRARNRRLTPEQATEQANFMVEEQLRPNAGGMFTGWIKRLQEALHGGAAPAAAPGIDMGQWQG